MISAFPMGPPTQGPAASGRERCDIDRVLFRVANSRDAKIGKSLDDENIPITWWLNFKKIGAFL